jgi:hypothetical protein
MVFRQGIAGPDAVAVIAGRRVDENDVEEDPMAGTDLHL